MGRPAIPINLQRRLKEEAGYRCAVPTCRDKGPFDYEHIDEWARVKKHEFANMVLLCVGCHARVTRGEIEKSAIRNYKANLAVISGRYSLFEQRMLKSFMEAKLDFIGEEIEHKESGKRILPKFEQAFAIDGMPKLYFDISYYDRFHFSGLVDDGIVTYEFSDLVQLTNNRKTGLENHMPFAKVTLTEYGERFISNMHSGLPLLD